MDGSGIQMSGTRAGLSIGVIVALVVAIWAAVSSGGEEPAATTTTTTVATATTVTTAPTTTVAPSTTVTSAATSTTSGEAARLEEVRLILEDLYFRWFDAIYRNDEEAVMDVIATPERLEDFRRAAAEADYPRAPELEDVQVTTVDILRDDPDCLVAYFEMDLSGWRGSEAFAASVPVLWPHANSWRIATNWQNKGDQWAPDCTASRDNELP